MCAICGVFHYRGGAANAELVARMAKIQEHRGPDDSGVWTDGDVALGNRRLAILDLTAAGHMPMLNEDASLCVTYNGEIYGWERMRAELIARGHKFRGRSDTEGLLHYYEELGDDMFRVLRGMYAFGLFDRKRRRLLLGRDRIGIKPLYYHDDGRRIVFASELKALLQDPSVPRRVDANALSEYLTYQYVPSPSTILEGVRRLPPAHYLVADASGVRIERYWRLSTRGGDRSRSAVETVAQLRELLEEAVKLRLQADVPVGAFLSGGIDSSTVAALMCKVSSGRVKTFCIGFEEPEFDERPHARLVAEHLGTDHAEEVVQPKALELVPRLVWQFDEPFADPSAIPTYYLCRLARRSVTAALSGDGGDEIFGGYMTYPWARAYGRVDRIPRSVRRLLALPSGLLPEDHPLGKRLRRMAMRPVDRHLDAMSYFRPKGLGAILSPDVRRMLGDHDPLDSARSVHSTANGQGPIAALAYMDSLTYLPDDILTKVDRASMAHSLEARVPFVDHHVMEFAATIPFDLKLRGDVTKWVLKESVRDLLPPEIVQRPKQGFAVPLCRWLGGDFGRLAREVLLDPAAKRRGFFAPPAVEQLLQRSDLRLEDQARRVWALVCFELWSQIYLDRAPLSSVTAQLAAESTGEAVPLAMRA